MRVDPRQAAWFVATLILVAALGRHQNLFLIAAILGTGLCAAYFWSQAVFSGVSYIRRTSHPRIFYGEDAEYIVDVSNPRLLPIPWLEAVDEIPDCMEVVDATRQQHHLTRRAAILHTAFLRWFERVTRRYRLRCPQRGFHQIGPTTMTSGDPFGLFENEQELADIRSLIVYPRVCRMEHLRVTAARPSGQFKGNPWLFEDPEKIAGIRPYRSSDPMRRIHWKATARTSSLQVKVHEPSYSTSLAVFLDVSTYRVLWERIDEATFEFGITTAASILLDAYDKGLAVGVYTNGLVAGAKGPIKVPPGNSSRHIMDALEALSMVRPVASSPLSEVIAAELPKLPYGASLIAVSYEINPDLIDQLTRCQARGNPATLIVTSEQTRPDNLPITTYLAYEEGHAGESTIALR